MEKSRIWRLALVLLVVGLLASCSNDDESFNAEQLGGTWEQIYDKGVVAEGYVEYTFVPQSPTGGHCTIHVYDVFAGDTTLQRAYAMVEEGRRLYIFEEMFGGNPQTQEYAIEKLSDRKMTWRPVGSDVLLNFKKTASLATICH